MLKYFLKLLTPKDFEHSLRQLLPNPEDHTFLLAVSGGVDSMVLLDLFRSLNFGFQVAHVNYHLRGDDSNADQQLVQDYCTKHHINFHLYEVSEKDERPQHSIQNWARNLRYAFFAQVRHEEKIDFLVTAHHLNDQLETFLINLSRGTGIKGLTGIPANDNQILRPLLHFTKEELYDFANLHQIAFREDLSNKKNDYLRNRVRHNTVPELTQLNPQFLMQFGATISHLKQSNQFIENSVNKAFSAVIMKNLDNGFVIDKKKLMEHDPFLVREIMRKLGFTGDEIGKVIGAENGKFFRSKSFELQISKNEITCCRRTV